IGVPPVALGIRGDEVLFTYVKPCHGTFVMGVDSSEEIARLREKEEKKIKKTLKEGQKQGSEKDRTEADTKTSIISYGDVYKNK
ncbi:MAG: DUF1894 domain-containing protein, partial [Methanothrix soehngenii]|nr:DUF1894 domain-containing protein [Methanothrix soehngenii]